MRPWLNGESIGLLIRRLQVRVLLGAPACVSRLIGRLFYCRKVLLTARPQGDWECPEGVRGQLVGEGSFACASGAVGWIELSLDAAFSNVVSNR